MMSEPYDIDDTVPANTTTKCTCHTPQSGHTGTVYTCTRVNAELYDSLVVAWMSYIQCRAAIVEKLYKSHVAALVEVHSQLSMTALTARLVFGREIWLRGGDALKFQVEPVAML
jgi:hypothetical protein